MLNISNEPLHHKVDLSRYSTVKKLMSLSYFKRFNRFMWVFFIVLVLVLFLPWTQNITGRGFVTTLKPDHRPQTIQSQIPGRIEKWFVMEGDLVKKGDTILKISEVKSDYFDEKLLERTKAQLGSKGSAVNAYSDKAKSLSAQVNALINERRLKLAQTKNKVIQTRLKVKSDSIDLVAANTQIQIAQTQFDRETGLAEKGLKATKDVEAKKLKLQAAVAKQISQENKLLESRNALINAQIELDRIQASYADKIAKARSEYFTAQSNQYNAEAELNKLENNYANYERRTGLRFVVAPQDGFINKALKGGIGETFKEGEQLVSIMPSAYELAVETYVRPIDLPLIHPGERVRVQFDGWPAIVFSGWEGVSYGTYGAKVVAVENSISDNGMYRILLKPDVDDHVWPKGLRPGSGARTIALLNDVPIWFELWRQLNGFPPNYYTPTENNKGK